MKTEINIYVLIGMLLIHWLADFVMQTDKMARGKSTSNIQLTSHVFMYSSIWSSCCSIYVWFFYVTNIDGTYSMLPNGNKLLILFPAITFVCHWITDYFTSRLNSKLWLDGKVHLFFVSIGFDQILHYIQLLVTFQLLS